MVLQKEEERHIIEAAQKDPRRFAELYESHFDRVYAFVVRRVRAREEAEDLTASVFFRAFTHLGQFQWRGASFAAWLIQIARNALADYWKRIARERGNPGPEGAEESSLEDIERRAILFRLVRTLPPAQRRVIVGRFADGKSIRELAQELRRTEGAVKQLQFRALENLRARMKESYG